MVMAPGVVESQDLRHGTDYRIVYRRASKIDSRWDRLYNDRTIQPPFVSLKLTVTVNAAKKQLSVFTMM
jgi:hypothetical protein